MRVIFIFWATIISTSTWAQGETLYQVSFENAAHHEAQISATFKDVKAAELEILMSRASPGRYALQEFAKNVYNVSAVNSKGEPLTIYRPNPYQWNVSGHDGQVTITYTLFADRADGTYSQVDRTHAHLNIPATFMWTREHENNPVRVTFKPFDDSWKVATQMEGTSNPYSFTAPNLYYFMDSPIEISDHQVRSWTVNSNGKDYTIKLAVHHEGTNDDLNKYVAKAKAVVKEHIKVYGEMPDLDYGEYVFLACYLAHVNGDGMEHRNSTVLTNSTSLDEGNFGQLGTLSHEFFHTWNVERIRPKELEPFNFTVANMTTNLWFVEGFTSYYGGLLIRRAKESSVDDYLSTLSQIVNQANLAPGRHYFTPEGASQMAAFTDAGTSIDKNNFSNIFFSYYIYGRAVALALDLSIRVEFPEKSLDSFMAMMWTDFGKPERPYTRDDLRETLAKVLGDTDFANNFFTKHIYGQNAPNFEKLMAPAGLSVKKAKKNKAYLGPINFKFEGKEPIVNTPTQVGSPLYNAGIERGDRIVKLGRYTIRSEKLWTKSVAKFDVGDTTTIKYISKGDTFSREITFVENPQLVVKKIKDGRTDPQKDFLTAWIGEDK